MHFTLIQNRFSRKWRWRLIAPNNKIVAIGGETYWNKADCINSIQLVKDTNWNTPTVEIH